ncbi:MAG: 2,3,4,5-tetrahydropyridine-2,6-dicarboxylate N-acetyltransferase [Clostridia bacterium]|nr:2,3,4,5-tetrahydropyridine-2,6-dicarboxylate N-acetyltransferase [Clostridia bacterium]
MKTIEKELKVENSFNAFTSEQLADFVKNSPKKTIIKGVVKTKGKVDFKNLRAIGKDGLYFVTGDKKDFFDCLNKNGKRILDFWYECVCANSGVGLMDLSTTKARIEPSSVIRQNAFVDDTAVVMMGAVLNIGCKIGKKTMVDMNAVVGSNAQIGDFCHIGAGAVIAGVLEPVGATPVVIEDNCLIGANSVVLEGCRVGNNSVVGAGAVVTKDIPPFSVAIGCPAVVKKRVDNETQSKTQQNQKLYE